MSTTIDQLDPEKIYTYADYLTWRFQERVELLSGKVFKMSPAPNLRHQRIVREVSYSLEHFLRDHDCELFIAPFDVRLTTDDKDTVVQPDLCVVCDERKLDEKGCNGAPDLIVEVLSPGNSKREMRNKFSLYENAGVREYWIIDPVREHILPYVADTAGKFMGRRAVYAGDRLASAVVKGFVLEAAEILNELDEE